MKVWFSSDDAFPLLKWVVKISPKRQPSKLVIQFRPIPATIYSSISTRPSPDVGVEKSSVWVAGCPPRWFREHTDPTANFTRATIDTGLDYLVDLVLIYLHSCLLDVNIITYYKIETKEFMKSLCTYRLYMCYQ